MDAKPSQPSAARPRPLFADIDVPCPQCDYNLRGLAEPRCPECGFAFDPRQLLEQYRHGQLSLSLGWILRNMYWRPVRFWRMPEVLRSSGPSTEQVFTILVFTLYTGVVVNSFLLRVLGGDPWDAIHGASSHPGSTRQILDLLPPPLMHIAGAWLLLLIHGVMSQVFTRPAMAAPPKGRPAWDWLRPNPVVGYASAWAIPAVTCLLVAELQPSTLAWVVRGSALPPISAIPIVMAVAAAGLIASCILWAVALYSGGLVASRGRRGMAVWYAASNPFWLAVLLMVLA